MQYYSFIYYSITVSLLCRHSIIHIGDTSWHDPGIMEFQYKFTNNSFSGAKNAFGEREWFQTPFITLSLSLLRIWITGSDPPIAPPFLVKTDIHNSDRLIFFKILVNFVWLNSPFAKPHSRNHPHDAMQITRRLHRGWYATPHGPQMQLEEIDWARSLLPCLKRNISPKTTDKLFLAGVWMWQFGSVLLLTYIMTFLSDVKCKTSVFVCVCGCVDRPVCVSVCQY